MTLQFKVAGQHIVWVNNTEYVVADSRNYLKAVFDLPEEWTYPVTVLFKGGCKAVPCLLAKPGEAITVPAEVIKPRVMLVSCYCGDLMTTDSARVEIRPSGYVEDTSPPVPPTPDLYQKLLSRVEKAQASAEANAEKTAADCEAVSTLSQTAIADITQAGSATASFIAVETDKAKADIAQTVNDAEAAVESKAEKAKGSVENAAAAAQESISASTQAAKSDITQTAQSSAQNINADITSAAESAKSAATQDIVSAGETAKQAVASEKNTAVKAVQDTSAAEQQKIKNAVAEAINEPWILLADVTTEEDVTSLDITTKVDGVYTARYRECKVKAKIKPMAKYGDWTPRTISFVYGQPDGWNFSADVSDAACETRYVDSYFFALGDETCFAFASCYRHARDPVGGEVFSNHGLLYPFNSTTGVRIRPVIYNVPDVPENKRYIPAGSHFVVYVRGKV